MSSYFDEMSGGVSDATRQFATVEAFLEQVEQIEAEVIADVTLNTGDREFPDDLRERILGIIAIQRVESAVPNAPTEGRRIATMMRYSPMIDELHSAYHELARRRIWVRHAHFCWLDSPRGNNNLRDSAYEEGAP